MSPLTTKAKHLAKDFTTQSEVAPSKTCPKNAKQVSIKTEALIQVVNMSN
jgi:hypothetical protein